MKNLNNLLQRHLEVEEMQAVLEAVKILERAFKKKVHTLWINPDKEQPTQPFGITLSFDQWEIR